MRNCEREAFDRLTEALEGVAKWHAHGETAQALRSFKTVPVQFCGADGVLMYEDGLKILKWTEAMERVVPGMGKAKHDREVEHRRNEMRKIMRTELPPSASSRQ
jgi:hypothetical protein